MNRRALLSSVGFLGASSLAGCLDRFPLSRSTTLGRLTVSNHDGDAGHSFGLRVVRDGEVVHESSHAVDRMEGDQIPGSVADCTWNPVAGRYVVSARVDEGDWNEFDLLKQVEKSPDCVVASVHYEPGPNTDQPVYVLVRADCDRYAGAVGYCRTNGSNNSERE
ncbi:hypothetical protein AUR64_05130 [Haloprofundus marisrubri]|uniref:Lipoprotein n=1 Tax=Haloprofundus marisrubri TaxID=1514971 RepID=A0A0W1RDG6_9EURY|nr:hypothetical protein [Haloprofundus marisrubri]KTG11096.1 hypothetical protein AUR64_05130 [Haloprofundus marisrubri]